MLIALTAARKGSIPPTPSIHRLRRGLPGYLILFAPPRFRASTSVTVQKAAFATGVPPNIYAFHRYTRIPLPSPCTQAEQYYRQFQPLKAGFSSNLLSRLRALTPNNSQRSPLRITTRLLARELAGTSSRGTSLSSSPRQRFTIRKPSSSRGVALGKAFAHCPIFPPLPPVGVWAVSQSPV